MTQDQKEQYLRDHGWELVKSRPIRSTSTGGAVTGVRRTWNLPGIPAGINKATGPAFTIQKTLEKQRNWGVKRYRPESEGGGWHWYTNDRHVGASAEQLAQHYNQHTGRNQTSSQYGSRFVAALIPPGEKY